MSKDRETETSDMGPYLAYGNYRETDKQDNYLFFLCSVLIKIHANSTGILIWPTVRIERQTNKTIFVYALSNDKEAENRAQIPMWLWVKIERKTNMKIICFALSNDKETEKPDTDPYLTMCEDRETDKKDNFIFFALSNEKRDSQTEQGSLSGFG